MGSTLDAAHKMNTMKSIYILLFVSGYPCQQLNPSKMMQLNSSPETEDNNKPQL